jgi:hypothetical protein
MLVLLLLLRLGSAVVIAAVEVEVVVVVVPFSFAVLYRARSATSTKVTSDGSMANKLAAVLASGAFIIFVIVVASVDREGNVDEEVDKGWLLLLMLLLLLLLVPLLHTTLIDSIAVVELVEKYTIDVAVVGDVDVVAFDMVGDLLDGEVMLDSMFRPRATSDCDTPSAVRSTILLCRLL